MGGVAASSYSRFCWQGHDNQAFCKSIKKSKNILSFFATCRSLVLVALPAKSRIRAGSKTLELNKNWAKLRKRSKNRASGGAYGRRERLTRNSALRDAASLCVTQRLLKSWRGLRSFACDTVCNIEDGGREGGRRAGVCSNASASGVSCSWETFGFPLFARGSFEVRSWLQKRCRCRGGLGGAKLQAAENQRKSVLFFARGSMCDFGFCRSGRIFAALVCLGECEVFASELALAEACADPKSGPRGGPKFGAVPFGN